MYAQQYVTASLQASDRCLSSPSAIVDVAARTKLAQHDQTELVIRKHEWAIATNSDEKWGFQSRWADAESRCWRSLGELLVSRTTLASLVDDQTVIHSRSLAATYRHCMFGQF